METDICEPDSVMRPNSPAARVLNKFGLSKNADECAGDKLSADLREIYERAKSSAVNSENYRDILLRIVSGL